MGVVGVEIPAELNTPLQSHNLPCYQHAGRCAMQKLQLENMVTT